MQPPALYHCFTTYMLRKNNVSHTSHAMEPDLVTVKPWDDPNFIDFLSEPRNWTSDTRPTISHWVRFGKRNFHIHVTRFGHREASGMIQISLSFPQVPRSNWANALLVASENCNESNAFTLYCCRMSNRTCWRPRVCWMRLHSTGAAFDCIADASTTAAASRLIFNGSCTCGGWSALCQLGDVASTWVVICSNPFKCVVHASTTAVANLLIAEDTLYQQGICAHA